MKNKFVIEDGFIYSLVNYLQKQPVFIILDSNNYNFSEFNFIAAWGVKSEFQLEEKNLFEEFYKYHQKCNDLIFGHISYDVKNIIYNLSSNNKDYIEFPLFYFFQPKYILEIKNNIAIISCFNETIKPERLYNEIIKCSSRNEKCKSDIIFKQRMSKSDYLLKVQELKKHLQLGNIYEVNFCQEFYAENIYLNPYSVYLNMRKENPTPFSAFYKLYDKYLICASPERYLKKKDRTVISQPIKGTIKRGKKHFEDEELIKKLKKNEKDRIENIMIVDLVRNDLSLTAEKESVVVKELCEIYTYPTVHQMISTVQSTVKENIPFTDIIKTTFPMGSMTGVPKIRAMQLIDEYETIKRGLYSGTVGYICPNANFDFNVVIRSLQYNSTTGYASFITGGAITIQSSPEEEYQECLVKAQGILRTLKAKIKL